MVILQMKVAGRRRNGINEVRIYGRHVYMSLFNMKLCVIALSEIIFILRNQFRHIGVSRNQNC